MHEDTHRVIFGGVAESLGVIGNAEVIIYNLVSVGLILGVIASIGAEELLCFRILGDMLEIELGNSIMRVFRRAPYLLLRSGMGRCHKMLVFSQRLQNASCPNPRRATLGKLMNGVLHCAWETVLASEHPRCDMNSEDTPL